MNYLKITNNGLICAEDLMLIGSSTKREQAGKIGMFGSGWKYALAWLIRNECTPIIYAGKDKIEVDYDVRLHRDNPVKVITVNGQQTSLTTEMGPKWTGWMAIREVLSNAIDEGGHTITTAWLPEFGGIEGQTVIYIPMNGELSEVMLRFDTYFSFNRKESYKSPYGRIFLKTEPSPMNIYRKGIRCYDTAHHSLIDIDFNDIPINEDRLTQSYSIYYAVRDIVKSELPTKIFKSFLLEENSEWLNCSINDNVLSNLSQLAEQGETFTTATLQKLGGMFLSNPDSLIVPPTWYKRLQDLGLVKSIFEMFDGSNEQFIRTDARSTKGVTYYLSNFNMPFEIRTGKCESEVFVNKGIAYVKDDTNLSDKQIAAHIIKRTSLEDFVDMMR